MTQSYIILRAGRRVGPAFLTLDTGRPMRLGAGTCVRELTITEAARCAELPYTTLQVLSQRVVEPAPVVKKVKKSRKAKKKG